MRRWTLPILMSVVGLLAIADRPIGYAAEQQQGPQILAQAAPPQLETPLERSRTLLQSAKQAAAANEREAAIALFNQAQEVAQQIDDQTQRESLLAQVATGFTTVGELDAAIALAASLSYDTLPPEQCCAPVRIEAEMAIARAYMQQNQPDQAEAFALGLTFEPARNQVLIAIVEAWVSKRQFERATALLSRINNPDYNYDLLRAQFVILEGYAATEQFEQGLAFSRSIGEVGERSGARYRLVRAAMHSGRLAIATRIAQQIEVADTQIQALVDIALSHAAVGEPTEALALMEQAYTLEQRRLEGDMELAAPHWGLRFAQAGAFDRALAIATSNTSGYGQAEGRVFVAQELVKAGQPARAFEVVQPVRDGELQVLADYPDPKLVVVNEIVRQAATTGQDALVQQAALSFEQPVHRAQALNQAAQIYIKAGRTDAANAVLDQALTIGQTIESISIVPDRHTYYQVSNAELLQAIAQHYATVGNRAQAIVALEAALASVSARSYDSEWIAQLVVSHESHVLQKSAQLFAELGQPERARQAVRQIEALSQVPNIPAYQSFELLGYAARTAIEIGATDLANELFSKILAAEADMEADDGERGNVWSTIAQLYAAKGNSQQAIAYANRVLALPLNDGNDPSQRDWRIRNLAGSLTTSADPTAALALIQTLSTPTQQIAALIDVADRYIREDQRQAATLVVEQLVQTARAIPDDTQRDPILSNGICGTYYVPSCDREWAYDLALQVIEPLHDPVAKARNLAGIALGFAQVGNSTQAEAAMAQAVLTAQHIQDEGRRDEWLSEQESTLLNAGYPDLMRSLSGAYGSSHDQIAALRRVAQHYVRHSQPDAAKTTLQQANTLAGNLSDRADRTRLQRAIARQLAAVQ